MSDKMATATDWHGDALTWLNERPPAVQDKARAYPPWVTYRLTTTGQSAKLVSYNETEDGSCDSCTVVAWQAFAPALTRRQVFGIKFSDLEPIAE